MATTGSEERVAIVTGGTRGMGAAISVALAETGIRVMAVYRANEDAAAETKKRLEATGVDTAVLKADVGFAKEAKRVAETAGERWGRIDILVNNAGVFDFSFLEDMSEAFFDDMMRTNLKSMVFMTKSVVPWMKKHEFGRILNATSISGSLADVGLVAYACSKAGVNLLTKVTAGELAPYGITVNAYAPGIVHTDMTDGMIRERGHLQVRQIPAGRFGTSEEIAGLIRFLSSDEASYINGEIIGVDGGMMKVQNPYRAYERAGKEIPGA